MFETNHNYVWPSLKYHAIWFPLVFDRFTSVERLKKCPVIRLLWSSLHFDWMIVLIWDHAAETFYRGMWTIMLPLFAVFSYYDQICLFHINCVFHYINVTSVLLVWKLQLSFTARNLLWTFLNLSVLYSYRAKPSWAEQVELGDEGNTKLILLFSVDVVVGIVNL